MLLMVFLLPLEVSTGRNPSAINQNNIESICLKDASATAIYGSRAQWGNYYYN
jgi:hypothetical protein